MKKIFVLYPGTSATKDIMIKNFEQLLDKDKYKFSYLRYDLFNIFNKDFIESDIVIGIKAVASSKYVDIIKKYNNKLFIYLLDDDILSYYKLADKGFEQFSAYRPDTEWYKNTINTIKNSQVILASSKCIVNSIKQYNKNIIHIPTNVLKKNIDENEENIINDNIIKIAHLGGLARKREYGEIWNDLVSISNKYKEKIEFYFYGWDPPRKNEIIYSKISFLNYNNNYYDYLEIIKKEKIDILLSPLFDEGSKISKSNVKMIDACICNAIGIYSNSVVYEDIVHMENGIKVNSNDDWFNSIDFVINLNLEQKKYIINNAKKLVLNKYSTEKYLYIFKDMLDKKITSNIL